MMKFRYFSAASVLVLASAPVMAQTAAPAISDGEIVVTATRESSLLSRTPVALTAVTGEGLIKSGVTNATQLGDVAPSLSIDRNNGLQITIRGVTSTDNSEKGDPSAGFAVDGIFIARAQAQEVSFFDLERVEVLRGPQGTLFGRNTTAGVVSLLTAKPKLGKLSGSFDGGYGNFNAVQATGVVNVPVGEAVALRGAVNYDRRNSYTIPSDTTYGTNPAKENLSGRLSALIRPSDKLTVLVRGDVTSMKGKIPADVLISNYYNLPFTVPAAGQLGTDPVYSNASSDALRTATYAEAVQTNRNNYTWGITGDVAYRLSPSLTLNYLGSYRAFSRDETFTGVSGRLRSSGGVVKGKRTFWGDYDQNSQELRLAYNGHGLKLQTGAFYFHETSDIYFYLYGSQGFQPGQRGYVFGFPQKTDSKSLALFGQGTVDLTEKLRATAGIRWTKDDKSRVGATVYHATTSDPLDFTTGVQTGTTNPRSVSDSLNNAAVHYKKVTWRAGLEYDLVPGTLLYGTVSTGYKAGGFNDGCIAGTTNCSTAAAVDPSVLYYKPETITSYELGFKSKLAGNALRLNGSFFHYDYTNLQLSQLVQVGAGTAQRTLNAGAAKVDGVELEAVVKPAANHQLDVSVSWLNARYTDYAMSTTTGSVAQFAGKKLDRSPSWSLSAGYTLTAPLANGSDLAFNVHTRVSGEYFFASPALRAQFRQPGFTKTDLSVTYTAKAGWYLQGYAKNLEDNITLASVTPSANFGASFDDGTVQFADPRTFGARFGVKF